MVEGSSWPKVALDYVELCQNSIMDHAYKEFRMNHTVLKS